MYYVRGKEIGNRGEDKMENRIRIVVNSSNFKRETEKAILVTCFIYNNGYETKDIWFPKSQVQSITVEKDYGKDEYYIEVSNWIFERKVEEFGNISTL